MKIGITSSFNHNHFASILLSLLSSKFGKPSCIILSNRSKFFDFKERARFFLYLLKKIRAYSSKIVGIKRGNQRHSSVLQEYIASKKIEDWDLPLTEFGKKHRIEFIVARSINSQEIFEFVKSKGIDILINAGGGIYKNPIIYSPKIGILNAHMGYLPSFRGMNALEWSLFYGHQPGVTLHFIDCGIDTGDILIFREITIQKDDSIDILREKAVVISIELILEGLYLIKNEKEIRIKQNLDEGKQYFVMHDRLKEIIEKKLKIQHI